MLTTLITASFILSTVYFTVAFISYSLDNITQRRHKMIYNRYNKMTVPTLKAIAKSRGITRYSRLKKREVILMLMA